jgi:hypothetical protein
MSGDPNSAAEQAEALLKQQLGARVSCLRVLMHEKGVVLRGCAFSYYVKQLAQHAAMQTLGLPVFANEIEVRGCSSTR